MDIRKKVQNLMQSEELCVISTVNSNEHPESALVAFSSNDKFELMIGTSGKSRKFQNIINNPNASIVIGFDGEYAIQYEGRARKIEGDELTSRLINHFKKHPGARKYQSDPAQVYLSIKPSWLRFVKSDPLVLGEIREF